MFRPLAPFLALCLAACGSEAKPANEDAPAAPAKTAPAPAARTVASNVIPTDELLWDLGPQVRERVVAVSSLADDPRYSQVANKWPKAVARLGTNPEEVLVRAPDLIFVASFTTPEYRAALQGHTQVILLENFSGFDGFRSNLKLVGEAVGADAEASKIRARFDAREAELSATRPKTRPTCLAWNEGYVPGKGTTFYDVAVLAGCEPIAASKGLDGHQPLDLEQILAWDPDVFVVSCDGDCEGAVGRLKARAGLKGLRAVSEGRVAVIEDAAIGSVGEGMLDFAAQLQQAL